MPTNPSEIHGLLDKAEHKYHEMYGHLSNGRPAQFDHFLAGLRMAVDHSTDEAAKEAAEKDANNG